MVEAWRLNKHTVYEAIPANQQLHLFFIFTGKEMPEYEPVKNAVIKGIGLLTAAVGVKADTDLNTDTTNA